MDPLPSYFEEVDQVAKRSLSPGDRKLLASALANRNGPNLSEVHQQVLKRWDAAKSAAEDAVPHPYGIERADRDW
jgi:hypothetical protein